MSNLKINGETVPSPTDAAPWNAATVYNRGDRVYTDYTGKRCYFEAAKSGVRAVNPNTDKTGSWNATAEGTIPKTAPKPADK